MKKTILVCLICGLFAGMQAQLLDDFIVKAGEAEKILEKKETEQIRLKKRYEYTAIMINKLKEDKAKGGITGTVASMRLSYYLKTGNKTGYRHYMVNNEIRELRDERFTYIMIIIDEYTKTLRECFKNKCQQAADLFSKREKWMASLDEYKDMMQIDFDFRDVITGLKPEAKQDLIKYLEGKAVQTDERLYLLKEEKNILKEAAAAGLVIDAATGNKNVKEIEILEKMKKKIVVIIEGIK